MKYPFLGRKIAVGVVVALTAAACGSSNASSSDTTAPRTESTDTTSDGTEVSRDLPVPTIDVTVEQDAKAGQNLTVDVNNFEVAPEAASTETVQGEGHFHLYVDGERTLRFYNEAIHLELEPGSHEVMVELSSNDHSAWTLDGEPITAMASIDVPETGGEGHGHSETNGQDVAGFESEPSVEITITKDPKSGWNVHAPVENFRLSAENASGEPVDGEGHAYLLVDGENVERLYGPWWHISNLEEGDHDITVELRANDHAALTLDGETIAASADVTVSAEEAAEQGHDHGDDHSKEEDGGHNHGESSGSLAIEDGLTEADAESTIEFVVADGDIEARLDGEVVDGAIEIDSGTVVKITTTSDVEEQVHLHGHDVLVDVSPGTDGAIIFTADIQGTLEVELEGSGTLLANLRVS